MKKTKTGKKITSLFLCMMLTVAMAFTTTGCGDKQKDNVSNQNQEINPEDITVLGEGQTTFSFSVVDKEGNTTYFEIHTDETIVGDALLALDLIAGDAGPYGLYVKTVNGITADYDVDATYWAFYINDAYATSGVDTTPVTEGESYSFRVEK